ncbi:MAG TPA: VWA domain-containing protein [Abditibacteriaceae bacterium]|nr:VWA domain-containing protein [Abditibacteriaceae bacterium]
MLHVFFKPHRSHLAAATKAPQKIFALLKVIPQVATIPARAACAFIFVLDASGSMNDRLDSTRSGSSKLQSAVEAARSLLDDESLRAQDKVSIIAFSDTARVLLPLSVLGDGARARAALDTLTRSSGGTQLGEGLRAAWEELMRQNDAHAANRVLVLTDGETADEALCREMAPQFGSQNIPIVAVGVGQSYNENLLGDLSEATQGRPYHLNETDELREVLQGEARLSSREIVTNVQLEVRAVKGVRLESATRVYPSLSDVALSSTRPLRLGNIASGDYSVFVLEFAVEGLSRPAGRARLAQLLLSGQTASDVERQSMAPQELFVSFTQDASATTQVDAEVLGYVQQKNADRLVRDAMVQAKRDAKTATRSLHQALEITRRLGNAPMTKMLQDAVDELQQTGTLSSNRRKTVSLGGRTRTVAVTLAQTPQSGQSIHNIPDEAEIRRLTGTE